MWRLVYENTGMPISKSSREHIETTSLEFHFVLIMHHLLNFVYKQTEAPKGITKYLPQLNTMELINVQI